MDVSNEIQETLGRSYNVPDDIDEEELMGGKAHIGSLIFFIICMAMHIYKLQALPEKWKNKLILCLPFSYFVSWKMQNLMLWKLIWTLNQSQSHLTFNRIKNLNSTYLLHQLAMQQPHHTSSRRMNWDCLQFPKHPFVHRHGSWSGLNEYPQLNVTFFFVMYRYDLWMV